MSLQELIGFNSLSLQKMSSCGGYQRWGAPALGYHWVTPPQEALSGLLWAIPLPAAASTATSHPFPAVLWGIQQLRHFLCLPLPPGSSGEWRKHYALVCSAQTSQGKAPTLESFRQAAPCQAGRTDTPANRPSAGHETCLILGETPAIRPLIGSSVPALPLQLPH